MDYDYLGKLSEEERIWLAAFSQEFYKGWACKGETQVHPPELLRESNAAHQRRVRRGGDTMDSGERRAGTIQDHSELGIIAGRNGMDAHEMRGRNAVEDEMVRWLDRPRRVK